MIVREYQTEFEKLANCIEWLDDALFCSYFISRIKEEIQVQVKLLNLNNMIAVIRLAKLAKDKFSAQRKNTKPLA